MPPIYSSAGSPSISDHRKKTREEATLRPCPRKARPCKNRSDFTKKWFISSSLDGLLSILLRVTWTLHKPRPFPPWSPLKARQARPPAHPFRSPERVQSPNLLLLSPCFRTWCLVQHHFLSLALPEISFSVDMAAHPRHQPPTEPPWKRHALFCPSLSPSPCPFWASQKGKMGFLRCHFQTLFGFFFPPLGRMSFYSFLYFQHVCSACSIWCQFVTFFLSSLF